MHPEVATASNVSGVAASSAGVVILSLDTIRPSPENERLYRPVDPEDPEIVALAESIAEHGVVEPIVVTRDHWILSGHRRYAAAHLAGLREVPCRVEPIRRSDDLDRFIRLLREYNRQRTKSLDEQLREEVVSLDPQAAYQSLLEQRLLREALDAVIDTDAFNRELEAERAEAVFLEGVRQRVRRALANATDGDDA